MKSGEVSKDRNVIEAYISDNQGNMVDTNSNYLTIEMYTSPDDGSLIYYNVSEGHNKWCENCNLSISFNEKEKLITKPCLKARFFNVSIEYCLRP